MTTPPSGIAESAVFLAALRCAEWERRVVGGVKARQSGVTARRREAKDFMVQSSSVGDLCE